MAFSTEGIVSTGIEIDFSSGFLAEIVENNGPELARKDVDMTHHGSDAMEYKPGKLIEGGTLEGTIAYKPSTAPPPIDGDPEIIQLRHPDSDQTPWNFTGYMNRFRVLGPIEERYVAEYSIKVTGPVTFG